MNLLNQKKISLISIQINNIDIILTTEKDFSRLFSKADNLSNEIMERLYYICIDAQIETREQVFYKFLEEKLYERK